MKKSILDRLILNGSELSGSNSFRGITVQIIPYQAEKITVFKGWLNTFL